MKYFTTLLFCITALGILPLGSRAQMSFQHLTTNDGLSHSTVMDILQDHRGFLWLATADGLNRYDGEGFRTFRRSVQEPNSLSNNYVNCLLEDRQRRLWVGTNAGGINRLDEAGAKIWRLTKSEDGSDISGATITDLALDKSGMVWAATEGNGLLKINPDTRQVWQMTTANSELTSNFVKQICFDWVGNLWVGDKSGVIQRLRLDDKMYTTFTLPTATADLPASIMRILCDRQGSVWVGTQGSGLFRFDQAQRSFRQIFFRTGVVEGVNNARSLYEDRDGRFWLGTDDGIIVAKDADFQSVKHLRHNPAEMGSLSTHATVCLRGDRQGNLWVGTWEGGLNVLFKRPDPFTVFTYLPGQAGSLLTKAVSAVATDHKGRVWVGSTQGLTCIDQKRQVYRHFQHRPGDPSTLPGNDVTQLHYLSERALLVTIWNEGSVLIDPETGRVSRRLAPLGLGGVTVVQSRTASDSLRIFTAQGEAWSIQRTTGQLRLAPPLPVAIAKFTSAANTADGTLWIGTTSNGLVEYLPGSPEARHHYAGTKPGTLHDNRTTCMFVDRLDRLWVGTMSGLHRFDRKKGNFTILDSDSGLTNDAIVSITQDREGFLWVATNDGLCRIDEAGSVVNTYRRSDGLAGNDFTSKAVAQSPDGTLYWGGKHGLTAYRRDQAERAQPLVPVYLTELRLFNHVVQPGTPDSPLDHALIDTKTFELRYEQSVFTFDFTAVLFRAHRNVRYAYKLEGFETDWNYVGSQHSATYTNQNPGSYKFRVKASLTDNFQDAPETVLDLTILPPWYRTGWAYAAYGLIVLILLTVLRHLIQIRENYKTELRAEHLETEKARELERIRTGFFTNISHEFRTPLTLIVSPLEQLLSDPAANQWRRQFQTMHRNASLLLRLINQLLDLSKLESHSFSPSINQQDAIGFINQVTLSFLPQAIKQDLDLRIEAQDNDQAVWFDQDIIEKVLYNLLANALKFTPVGGFVTVRCQILHPDKEAKLLLEVEDTGIGIPLEHTQHIFERFYQADGQNRLKKAGSGIGLALTRELVELHRGTISVHSQPEVGTAFVVELPVHRAAFPVAWLSGQAGGFLPAIDSVPDKAFSPTESAPVVARSGRTHDPLVLVVEDHDDLRNYLADCLSADYRVHTAPNGLEALDYARAEIPDLVVSDWLMPDMDGLRLCETLKSDERTSHVPVLLLTSRSSHESRVVGLDAGADDYVTKPFNLDVLLSRVRNLIESRRLLREKYSRMLRLPTDDQPNEPPAETGEAAFLRKVLSIIETKLSEPTLDVGLLERELGLSRTQLYRKLKALTGKGGNELIRSSRLQQAAQLLKASDRQVAEVAYDVGFNDPNYFIRVFKKEFGVSPGEWNKQNAGT